MTVRLGAVGYLNARPLVYGLQRSPRFRLRFDVPSTCAALLHDGSIDLGLIPSIEYLRGGPYSIVPDLAIASRGPVASVILYTRVPISDVRSIAMDVSSRTSVALVQVLCARLFKISPTIESSGPDLPAMLGRCDAALVIGDNALFQSAVGSRQSAVRSRQSGVGSPQSAVGNQQSAVGNREPRATSHELRVATYEESIDLGEAWTSLTGLPFVYAFWAGRADALESGDVMALQQARNAGVAASDEVARLYLRETPALQAVGVRYLRDNIKYYLGDEERAALELFYRYASEVGVAPASEGLRFFEQS
jgi:chorismate dehydratase